MPELPDISAYLAALEERIVGQPLEHVRIASAFLLRTAQPPVTDAVGHRGTIADFLTFRISSTQMGALQ
jgi:hypothetical protein